MGALFAGFALFQVAIVIVAIVWTIFPFIVINKLNKLIEILKPSQYSQLDKELKIKSKSKGDSVDDFIDFLKRHKDDEKKAP